MIAILYNLKVDIIHNNIPRYLSAVILTLLNMYYNATVMDVNSYARPVCKIVMQRAGYESHSIF